MIDLRILQTHRQALFLAEVAAWLHDWQKCIDMAVASHWQWGRIVDQIKIQEWQRRGRLHRPGKFSQVLETHNLSLLGESLDFKSLIETGRGPSKALDSDKYLVRVLGQSHKAAHVEKELKDDNENRHLSTDWASTPWGYESEQPVGFIEQLLEDIQPSFEEFLSDTEQRRSFLVSLVEVFTDAWGDTRYPINEVTLWSWSSIVASLYKSEIARCILTGERRQPTNIAWRLLSIRTDGLGYLLNAPGIPDMLARKDLLDDALNKVQQLLEETYPLGLEVYRDENGSLFVVPDVENITSELVDIATGKNLRQLILEAFDEGTVKEDRYLRVNGEIVPEIYSDSQPWNGHPSNGLPPVGRHLQRKALLESEPDTVADSWCGQREQVCTVCGLRPQGPSRKAKERGVCDVCEGRRADRARQWMVTGGTTIWLDEVADINGRLALLVGQFDLEHWLDGSLVRTLAVREPNDTNGHIADRVAKNPSFARIRRIWETTKRFWEEITDGLDGLVGRAGPRLAIDGANLPSGDKRRLGDYHAYELVVGHVKIAIVWDPARGRFITAANLAHIVRLLGHTPPKRNEGEEENDYQRRLHEWGRDRVQKHLVGTLTIEEPVGYGARNKEWGTITVEGRNNPAGRPYVPAIPILAEPRTFMAVVPADRALDVVRAIKVKYEREMGKVRNRLPLHLGIVYAHRRTPLRAVLDAGRRMLRQHMPPGDWWIVCSAKRNVDDGDPLPDRFRGDRTGQFKQWVEVTLEREERQLTWYVPAMMGDGKTEDHWYPYAFVESLAPDSPTRSRRFKAPNPWTKQDGLLVHVAELRPGDVVYFTPATLDFIWLGASGQRFEIAYDGDGHRRDLPRRPYLLDELGTLETIWQTLAGHLTTTQIHALSGLIEGKREEWTAGNGVFRQFCRDVLASVEWRPQPWGDDRERWLDTWADYAVRGWIADAVELHHHIMKEPGKE